MDRREFLKNEAERLSNFKKVMAEATEESIRELSHLKGLLEEFNKSELATHFKETLRDRLQEIDRDLRNAGTIEEVKFLQGESLGVNFWEILPIVMLERIKVDLEIAKSNREAQEES